MTGDGAVALPQDPVVVLGGGLAGVACAHVLGDAGEPVVLVDRNDYHQFQPLLYQVATSQLPAEDVARPHRAIFHKHPTVRVVTAEAVAVDAAAHRPSRLPTGVTVVVRRGRGAAGRPASSVQKPPDIRDAPGWFLDTRRAGRRAPAAGRQPRGVSRSSPRR